MLPHLIISAVCSCVEGIIQEQSPFSRRGAQLGDPDSMVSLADLIQRRYVHVENPEGARFALLSSSRVPAATATDDV
jgi:hypothetical protein